MIVSNTLERDDAGHNAHLLGEYTGTLPLDQKIEITHTGYLRGRWITIVDETTPMTVAEVRVYGSKNMLNCNQPA